MRDTKIEDLHSTLCSFLLFMRFARCKDTTKFWNMQEKMGFFQFKVESLEAIIGLFNGGLINGDEPKALNGG